MSFLNPWFYFQVLWLELHWASTSERSQLFSVLWPSWIVLGLSIALWTIVMMVVLKEFFLRLFRSFAPPPNEPSTPG